MKFKQYATLVVGVVAGVAISVIGVSYASQNTTNKVSLITSEQAKSIMMDKVPGGNFVEFSYDGDDRIPKYDGTLIKDNCEYEVDVNAKTGEVIKLEKEVIAISNNTTNSNNSNNVNTNTQQNATTNNTVNASTNKNTNTNSSVNDSTSNKVNTSTNKNTNTNNKVNAATNNNTSNKVNNTSNNNTSTNNKVNNTSNKNNNINNSTSSSYIGEAKAKSIMSSKVPGAKIIGFKFDNDNTPEYEADLIKDGYEYEISVNAKTGQITEFSKERMDYDD